MRRAVIGATAVALAVLAACGTAATPPPGTTRDSVVPSTPPVLSAAAGEGTPTSLVMVIRHGEKPDGDSESGVDVNGKPDDSSLTPVGWDRAHRLVDLFAAAPGAERPGLARPATIYAAGANDDGEGLRTRETVQPLAATLGVTVDTSYGKGDEQELVEHVSTRPGPTLISWQHGEIPSIAEAFPHVTPTPPAEWPDDRFDVVWTFTKAADGWHFAQLPELVLPQDRTAVIEN